MLTPEKITGRNIARRRSYLGITQAELARHIQRDSQYLSRVENGQSLPAHYLFPIARVLKIKAENLTEKLLPDIDG